MNGGWRRSRNTELEKQDKAHRAKIQELERARRPVELEVTRLKAEVESLEAEVKLVRSRPPSGSYGRFAPQPERSASNATAFFGNALSLSLARL